MVDGQTPIASMRGLCVLERKRWRPPARTLPPARYHGASGLVMPGLLARVAEHGQIVNDAEDEGVAEDCLHEVAYYAFGNAGRQPRVGVANAKVQDDTGDGLAHAVANSVVH